MQMQLLQLPLCNCQWAMQAEAPREQHLRFRRHAFWRFDGQWRARSTVARGDWTQRAELHAQLSVVERPFDGMCAAKKSCSFFHRPPSIQPSLSRPLSPSAAHGSRCSPGAITADLTTSVQQRQFLSSTANRAASPQHSSASTTPTRTSSISQGLPSSCLQLSRCRSHPHHLFRLGRRGVQASS
jgi:hypothetical protein